MLAADERHVDVPDKVMIVIPPGRQSFQFNPLPRRKSLHSNKQEIAPLHPKNDILFPRKPTMNKHPQSQECHSIGHASCTRPYNVSSMFTQRRSNTSPSHTAAQGRVVCPPAAGCVFARQAPRIRPHEAAGAARAIHTDSLRI